MSIHIHGSIVTGMATAANNRGLTEGNITTLQKVIWNENVHTTVSAEAIRFALRTRLANDEDTNRVYDETQSPPQNTWKDPLFTAWAKDSDEGFIDDDLLGFMQAEAAKDGAKKGSIKVRRAVLEVSRAVSLHPWAGDVTFNAASPGATPSAQKKGTNPVPYGTEMHATRYQYGFSMTPARLRKSSRAMSALKSLSELGNVAGNHGRFLFDFSPESIVIRVTHDPAPRVLNCFGPAGSKVEADLLAYKVNAGDIDPKELIIGGPLTAQLSDAGGFEGAELHQGVKKAVSVAVERLKAAS